MKQQIYVRDMKKWKMKTIAHTFNCNKYITLKLILRVQFFSDFLRKMTRGCLNTDDQICWTWVVSAPGSFFPPRNRNFSSARTPYGCLWTLIPLHQRLSFWCVRTRHNWGQSPAYFGISTKTKSSFSTDLSFSNSKL